MIEDQDVQRCLDPVTDAEFFACFDVDDGEAPFFVGPDEVGATG